MSLFSELKRRNVFRVAAAYLVVAWLLIEVADTIFPRLGLPDWTVTFVIALLLLGLPAAVFLAWAYEMTPEGVKRSADVTSAESVTPKTGKRIDRLILIGAFAVIAIMAVERVWFAGGGSEPVADPAEASLAEAAADDRQSIAVLPFTNMSPDPEQEFFADGITEDILTRLSTIGELRVINRTSIMRYKGSDKSLPEIAAELGVSHILEGSVRRAGDQVRITGQLIRAADDAHLWAESFDRELADIFAMQTEIAGQIVEALALRLTEGERERLAHQGTDNAAAYEQYLLGRARLVWSFTDLADAVATLDEAEAHFRAALEHDPDYADAWAGLARIFLFSLRIDIEPEAAELRYQAGADAARRAVRLAPESAAGYVWLGQAYLARGQGEAAAEQFRLAAEVEPDAVDVLAAQAEIQLSEGRLAEAVRLRERAVRIEPGDTELRQQLGWVFALLGELQGARAAYRVAWEELTPHEARLRCMFAGVDLLAGDVEAARSHILQGRALEPDSPFVAACALWVFLQIRDLDAARQVFEQHRAYFERREPLLAARLLARTQPDADQELLLARAEQQLREDLPRAWGSGLEYALGQIEALRGNPVAALAHLETAVDLGWRVYRILELDIVWDPIRDDPRFQALVRQVDEDLARQRAELNVEERPR